jgi:two-component system, NtrC family, sensor kinase
LKDDLEDLMEYINFYRNTIKEKGLEDAFGGKEKLPDEKEINIVLKEVEDLLRGIEEGAVRTAEIVKGLRNFSRLDQDALKKASLNEGIESTLTLLHSTYKDRIEIVKDLGNIPEVECFPGQINQVFMNLLSNAIQAIVGNGKIFVSTATASENKVSVTIRDTGSGIPEKIRLKIFDPFFTTKDVGKGTGLGLSISYGIIQKHHGTIEVVSEDGAGSTFIITLPIEQKTNH